MECTGARFRERRQRVEDKARGLMGHKWEEARKWEVICSPGNFGKTRQAADLGDTVSALLTDTGLGWEGGVNLDGILDERMD